jgi:hypothetical protein
MSEALIDFASLDSAASAVETPAIEPVVETPAVDSETPVVDAPVTETGVETETLNADGSEKSAEEQTAFKTAAAKTASDKTIDTKATPDNVRKALKTMRDADPKNAAVVKELHGAFERFHAYKTVFPTVPAAKEAKAFIESIGGEDGYTKLNQSIDAVKATDELLYAADPQLWRNVLEDLKATGHPEAFGKLAPAYLSELKAHDSPAFYEAFKPHFFNGLKESGMDAMVKSLNIALGAKDAAGVPTPDINEASRLVQNMTNWYKEVEEEDKNRTKEPAVTNEQKKFLEEKAAFEKTKAEDAQSKVADWENNTAETAEKSSNVTLGKALAPFLIMPYFKDFPRESKIDLGNGIKERLYAALKADKGYQTQMSALWKGGNNATNNAKIQKVHQDWLNDHSMEVVTKTVQQRYPGYAKGGTAAGRVAAAADKKTADTKAGVASVTNNKPIYVASRPTNLIRETVKVGGREYSPNDLQMMQIAGRGFVKSTDGKSYRLVTWRK